MEKSKIVLKVVVLLIAIFLVSNILLIMAGGSNIYETILGLKKDEITPNSPTVSGETTNDYQTADSGESLEKEDFKFYTYIEQYINGNWVDLIVKSNLPNMNIYDKALEESIIFIRFIFIWKHISL